MDNWRRAEADFDNYRKRTEQEKGEVIRFANAALILNLLPILDDFERAFNSLPAKVAGFSWVDGMRLVYRKLQATLEAQGISPIKAEGENFDPAIHDAVAQGEGEEGKVIGEIQRGYKLDNRLIRPALVIVGKGTEEKQVSESSTQ
jgi:molecular chaperone GrpE